MLRFTLQRLRFVSQREVPFRVRQQWIRRSDRWWTPPKAPPGPEVRWPFGGLQAEARAEAPGEPEPFRPGDQGPDATARPATADTTADQPEQGADPVERRWPGLAHDLDLLGGPADPRDDWETTRLQTATAAAARRWLDRNPPGRGVGWASCMEVALRLVSLVRLGAPRDAVHAHAAWVARHPSRGSSANNHRVAELGALALAARVLPDLPDAASWRREAAELAAVLRDQLHPDGAGVEQSPTYLAYDLEWALLARRCGVDGLDEPIDRAARSLAALVDSTGAVPALGDDDGGRVLAIGPHPEDHYVRSVVGAAGLATGGYRPDARASLLGAGPARRWSPRSACFPDGGLTALRGGDLLVVVDHGPVGGSALAAHGHADALATYIHDGHGPVVVGRGTGRYNADPAGRRFHRGTAAHPTVVVDGADQSEPADHPFLWRRRAEAHLDLADLDQGLVRAWHDGYRGRGVVHRRTVRLVGSEVVLEDELLGVGLHHAAVHLPLAPGLRVEPGGSSTGTTTAGLIVWRGDRKVAELGLDARLEATVVVGGPRPGLGWHSPAYGRWVEAPAVVAAGVVTLPVALRTVVRLHCRPWPGPSIGGP